MPRFFINHPIVAIVIVSECSEDRFVNAIARCAEAHRSVCGSDCVADDVVSPADFLVNQLIGHRAQVIRMRIGMVAKLVSRGSQPAYEGLGFGTLLKLLPDDEEGRRDFCLGEELFEAGQRFVEDGIFQLWWRIRGI